MGLSNWLRRTTSTDAANSTSTGARDQTPTTRHVPDAELPPGIQVSVSFGPGWDDGEPVKISSTTTSAAAACRALFTAHGKPTGGHLELPALLVGESHTFEDGSHGVCVQVEGDRVGYLPTYLSRQLAFHPSQTAPCLVQLWAGVEKGQLRVIGWAAAGPQPVKWPHTSANPPAITAEERRSEAAAATTRMVNDALTGTDKRRAAEFKAGMVGNHHYLETVEPIKQLKREGRLEEALALCYGAITGAENDRGSREPAPWYTEQAAIIHRKRGERDEEVAVLRRWLAACPPAHRSGSAIQTRLDKLLRTS